MRNYYRFSTLTAIACLGLGLMTAGCSDGGGGTTTYPFNPTPPTPAPTPSPTPSPEPSPTPSPEPSPTPSPIPSDKAVLKVQFAIPQAKAEVPDAVTAYNFHLNIGDEESQAEEGIEKKADDDNPAVQTVSIETDPEVDNVLIEYLNQDGKTIAVSQFAVELTAGEETLADDFECLEASSLVVKGNADILHIGDDLTLTSSVIYGDEFSEDSVELEVSNDDMEYELADPDFEPQVEHIFEPKAGENGTFTAIGSGQDYIEAAYTEDLTSLYYATVLADDEEIAGYALWVYGFGSLDQFDNKFRMIHSENLLPERFIMDVPNIENYYAGIANVNDAEIFVAGMVNDQPAVVMQAEWSYDADYFQVRSEGQMAHINLTGAGTGGTITATIGEGSDKQEFTATLDGIESEGTAMLPVFKEEIDNDDGSVYVEYRSALEACGEGGDTIPLYPGGAYLYKDDTNYDGQQYRDDSDLKFFGFYGAETDNTITWSMAQGSSNKITIDATGLVTIASNAPENDAGSAEFTVSDYEPDQAFPCEVEVHYLQY